MAKKQFDYATFFYKIFLLVLIGTQIHLLFHHNNDLHFGGIIIIVMSLIYLIFRFYLLYKLGHKAKYLSLTLSQFLQKRDEYDAKCKEECDDNVKF